MIRKSLPQNCKAIILCTSGIIINNEEIEYKAFPRMVCALLPEIPNVKIRTTILCTEYSPYTFSKFSLSLFEDHKKKLIDMINETSIPLNHDESTSLIFLCNNLKSAKVATLLAEAVQECR